jgi:hypothetical protein
VETEKTTLHKYGGGATDPVPVVNMEKPASSEAEDLRDSL